MARRNAKEWDAFFFPEKQKWLTPQTVDEAMQLLDERVRKLNRPLNRAGDTLWSVAAVKKDRDAFAAVLKQFQDLEND